MKRRKKVIQAVLFNRSKFDDERASNFLHDIGLNPIKKGHTTKNYIRYRIIDPKRFDPDSYKIYDKLSYFGVKLDGVLLVVGRLLEGLSSRQNVLR